MKRILFLFALLSLTRISICQSIFSVLHLNEERDVTQGTPKSITNSKIFYSSNGNEEKKEQTEYDQSGLPVSKTFFDENGNVTTRVDYIYDTIKRIILESKLTELNVLFPTNRVRTLYQYETSNSPIRIQHLNSQGNVLSEVLLKNDSSGLPIKLQLFEPPGNLIGTEVASYIPADNKAIVSVANSDGKILSTDTMKINFKYAHKFHDPHINYNEKGDVTYSKSLWANGSIHYREYEYIYDKTGNWIDQKAFEVSDKSKGKKKREMKSHFKRKIIYW
jgi:hypothetical protein